MKGFVFTVLLASFIPVWAQAKDPRCYLFLEGVTASTNKSKIVQKISSLTKKGRCERAIKQAHRILRAELKRSFKSRSCNQNKVDGRIADLVYQKDPPLLPGEMGFSMPLDAIARIVWCLCKKHRLKRALKFIRTQELSRYDPLLVSWEGMILAFQGRYEKALNTIRGTCRGSQWCRVGEVIALAGLKRYKKAKDLCNSLNLKGICDIILRENK